MTPELAAIAEVGSRYIGSRTLDSPTKRSEAAFFP
jgi:hypothetical protein